MSCDNCTHARGRSAHIRINAEFAARNCVEQRSSVIRYIMADRRENKRKVPRSSVATFMFMRFRHTGGPMKDRRVPRGGSKNRDREYKESIDE